ncbi:MAG: hypothetical protein IKV25_00155 [Clostridia bacterium]|nr:hypothetical protein [Clostridia bacterium]
MSKKIIIAAVVLLAISVLFAACKDKENIEENPTTEPEITTAVDENGAYVFNKDNEKVYLLGEDGFYIDPKDAYNMPAEKEEDGFYIGGATDGEKEPNISWEELQ